MNKRVTLIQTSETGVHLTCADDSEYKGDLLVGADGANSVVRQAIFAQLQSKGQLSASDAVPLPYNCICLVGQTETVEEASFPELKHELCQTNNMVAIGSPYTVKVAAGKEGQTNAMDLLVFDMILNSFHPILTLLI